MDLSPAIENYAPDLLLRDLGRVSYSNAWQLQKELVELRIKDEIQDTILFCEHDPVITLGRGAQGTRAAGQTAVLASKPKEIEVLEIERGGLATYHGPGQIVVYPIVKLNGSEFNYAKSGLVGLIRHLEAWVIHYLRSEGFGATRREGATGVWVEQTDMGQPVKVASIGIAARHWVSYHGLALNFATGSAPWTYINPCGFGAEVMKDLNQISKKTYNYQEVKKGLLTHLDHFFV